MCFNHDDKNIYEMCEYWKYLNLYYDTMDV